MAAGKARYCRWKVAIKAGRKLKVRKKKGNKARKISNQGQGLILKQIEGIRCITCIADENTHVLSCPDAIGKAIEFYLKGSNKFDLNIAGGPKSIMICPEEGCGGIMHPDGGCYVCRNCGYSKCS